MRFDELNLHPTLLKAVQEEAYETSTPIQTQAIPHILAGRDLLGCAQTGTGKTAAFALPILNRLLSNPRNARHPRVLVLVPTRELATQVGESFRTYGRHTGLKCTTVFGGVSQKAQENALRAGVDILVAAPGRLLDLMGQRVVNLTDVEVLVLDEADRMLDMGFIKPIRDIVACLPTERQNLMFSATMPDNIRNLAGRILRNPTNVAVAPVAATVDTVEQQVYFIPQSRKVDLLIPLLQAPQAFRVVVFTRTKHGANRLAQKLAKSDIEATVIHGNKSQNARQRALEDFKKGSAHVLVATDVAARGLDVDGVTHVVNYDIPNEPESYVHRIGRTARAGASGVAISLCDPSERAWLKDIERLTRNKITVIDTPALPDKPAATERHHRHTEFRDPSHEHRQPRRKNEERDVRPREDFHGRNPHDHPAHAPRQMSRQPGEMRQQRQHQEPPRQSDRPRFSPPQEQRRERPNYNHAPPRQGDRRERPQRDFAPPSRGPRNDRPQRDYSQPNHGPRNDRPQQGQRPGRPQEGGPRSERPQSQSRPQGHHARPSGMKAKLPHQRRSH